MRFAEVKGLVPKYAVYPWSSQEAAKECHLLRANKIEYAQDEEGRIWRRIRRDKIGRFGRGGHRKFSELVRWHVADMYAWFPGEDPATISGSRRQNTRARPPKKLEVYLVNDKPLVLAR